MDSYLNDIEKEAVIRFNNDAIMKQAVKKVLLSGIYGNGVLESGQEPSKMNWVFGSVQSKLLNVDNEAIGQDVRAKVAGLGFLEEAFGQLAEIKKDEPVVAKANPAR